MAELGTRRSAVIAPIQLPPLLERLRYGEASDARRGVPAHVTLLYPFIEPSAIDTAVLALVAEAIASVPRFDVTFTAVRRWPPGDDARQGVVWLAPEPDGPFRSLTEVLFAAFPGCPPYEGRHAEVIPHLTLATDRAARFDVVEAEARRHLPLVRAVDVATVWVEGFDGQWRPRARFALR